jgi:hypothetical protein
MEGDAMLELFITGVVGFVVLAVFGLFAAVASFLWWVVAMPFKVLALAFKGIGVLLALPFLLLFALLGVGLFGVGLFALMLPALPFILLAAFVFWLFRRRDRSHATAA